ncbi:unnamed protein product [Malus baccata var. baccata]
MGFKMSQSDTSLFVKHDGSDVLVLLLYVDDIILTGSNASKVHTVIRELGEVFELKDMGQLSYFLGLQLTYKDNGDIFLSQSKYARDLIHKPNTQLLASEGTPLADPTTYRSLVGALQYLTFTRPDLSYSVNVACQYMNSPTEVHFALSKKQSSVSRSSTEAEYKALAHCAADIAWIRLLLKDLQQPLLVPPLLHCDNLSALALCANPVFHTRIKHLDTDFHFVREKVQKKDLMVQYVPTNDQTADVFTKGLHGPSFYKHCCNLSLGHPT